MCSFYFSGKQHAVFLPNREKEQTEEEKEGAGVKEISTFLIRVSAEADRREQVWKKFKRKKERKKL